MDQKNFIVAIVLSVVIIMGWQTLFPPTKTPPPQQQQTGQAALKRNFAVLRQDLVEALKRLKALATP